jgi:DNA-binding transcriptional MerR regulator
MSGLLVSHVAKQVGLHPETIRRLERKGVIVSHRDVNGWRRYSPDVIDTLRKLYAQSEGHDDGQPEPKRAA